MEFDAFGDGTLEQCQRLGIVSCAWSPPGGGAIFGAGDADTRSRACAVSAQTRRGPFGDATACCSHGCSAIEPVSFPYRVRLVANASGPRLQRQVDRHEKTGIAVVGRDRARVVLAAHHPIRAGQEKSQTLKGPGFSGRSLSRFRQPCDDASP